MSNMAVFDFRFTCVLLFCLGDCIAFGISSISVDKICEGNPTLTLPHDDECQLYYDCSALDPPSFSPNTKYVRECKYPQLFSTKSLKCEDFYSVVCGSRTEFKQKCDYRAEQCNGPNCINCLMENPSCEGYGDGENHHSSKPGSPWRMECYKGRLIGTFLADLNQD
nr:uncharacterized protein LOC105349142 [Crassostrea gigas]